MSHALRERHVPPPVLRLRRCEPVLVPAAPDLDAASAEVDVADAECDRLADPQAGLREEAEEQPLARRDRVQERRELVRCERLEGAHSARR
jgi:hypothetical protein